MGYGNYPHGHGDGGGILPQMNNTDPYWQRIYDAQRKNWWWKGRHALLRSLLDRFVPSGSSGRMLDIGCGPGFVVSMLDGSSEGFGIDHADGPLSYAASRGLRRLARASAELLPFKGATFDGIVALDSLEHMADDLQALRECSRVLKQGACMFLMVPAYPWLWTMRDDAFGHRRRYTPARLRGLMARAGFEAVKLTYYNAALVVPLIIARCTETMCRVPLGLADEGIQAVAPVVGVILGWLQALEARLVMGRGLPLGTTLVCVARKVSHVHEEK